MNSPLRFNLLILLLIFSFSASSQKLITDFNQFAKMVQPVLEGSTQEKKLLNYLEQFCVSQEIDYRAIPVQSNDFVSLSNNFKITIKGKGKEKENVVLLIPLNSFKISGKLYDNTYILYATIELIKKLQNYTFNRDIIFYFIGAYGKEGLENLGLKRMIEDEVGLLNNSMITVFDIYGIPEKINFTGSINRRPIPSRLLQAFISIQEHQAAAIVFNQDEIAKAKFNILSSDEVLEELFNQNLLALSYTNFKNQPVEQRYSAAKHNRLLKFFTQWVLHMDQLPFDENFDYNYKLFQMLNQYIIISETQQIFFYLLILLIVIIIRTFLVYKTRIRVSLFISIIPFFILLLFIYYFLSFIPLIIFLPIEWLMKVEQLYARIPLFYLINILIVPLLILFIFYEWIKKLPFPKHNYLYFLGATLLLYFHLILFTFFDISLTYIFLWAIILNTFAQLAGKKWVWKYLFYLLAFFPLFKLIYDLLIIGDIQLAKQLFSNPLYLHFIYCFVTYPLFLICIRVFLINESKRRKNIHSFQLRMNYSYFLLLILVISFLV
ncbi:MAG: hypothetical protein MJB14_08515, partial [Spirochaetes bacterium]|nr:hypothetical protein [Spirochaetota bacterium]